MKRTLKLPRQHRVIEASARLLPPPEGRAEGSEEEDQLVEIAISSEAEVRRDSWFSGPTIEILGHKRGEVLLDRAKLGLPFLQGHRDDSWLDQGDVYGRVVTRLDEDRVLRGTVRFDAEDPDAQKLRRKMMNGIRPEISVGYEVLAMKLVEEREDGTKVYRVTKWRPYEVSSVAMAADITVGVGRSKAEQEMVEVEIEEDGAAVQEEAMNERNKRLLAPPETGGAGATTETKDSTTRTEEARSAPAGGGTVTAGADLERERQRAAGIIDLCQAYGETARAMDFISRGLSVEQAGYEILKARKTSGVTQPASERLTMNEKERRSYRYTDAFRNILTLKEGGKPSNFAWDVQQEVERKLPAEFKRQRSTSALIPLALDWERAERFLEHWGRTRAMTATGAGKGAELVTDAAPMELIELLMPRMVCARLGVRILPGLTGPIPFPKLVGDMVAYWQGENPPAAVAESDAATDLAELAPRMLIGAGRFSRQLMMQSYLNIEQLLKDSIARAIALKADQSLIAGTGGKQPLGVLYAPGVSAVAMGGAITYGKCVDLTTKVAEMDADMGSLGFVTTPGVAGKGRQTLQTSGVPGYIWTGRNDNGEIAGYLALASNQIPKTLGAGAEHGIVFGNWGDAILGFYGVVEAILDEVTLAGQAMLKLTTFHQTDALLRHGESFAKGTGLTAA